MIINATLPNVLTNPDFHAHGKPHLIWEWMREHSPVYWHEPSDLPGFWSITRLEDVRSVYSNPKVFSSASGVLLRPVKYGDDPAGGLTLALTDPPRHKQLRHIISNWFTMPYAKSIEEAIRAKTKQLLTNAMEKGDFDFTQDVAARLALSISCYILGVPDEDHENVYLWSHEAFEEGKSLAMHTKFMDYFSDFMERKISDPSDDLASSFIHNYVDGKLLVEDEILLNFENLLGATENAGLSLAGGIFAFLMNPDSWELLKNNNDLLATTIEEILRWCSSATHSMRTVTETTVFQGKLLQAKQKVVLWLPSANRDTTYFKDPYKFDITRHPNRHVALGHGEHFCIGNALARVQMRVLLTELLNMKNKLQLTKKPILLDSIYVNGPKNLPVRFN